MTGEQETRRKGDRERRRQETEVGWNREVFSKIKAEAYREGGEKYSVAATK